MTALMLDTSVCVDLIRGDAPLLARAIPRHRGGVVMVSTITLAELRVGEARRPARARGSLVDDLLAPFEIAPFDRAAADAYTIVRTTLERRGTPIGPLDTLIAAHAVAISAALLTVNLREFRRVPGLTVLDQLPAAP